MAAGLCLASGVAVGAPSTAGSGSTAQLVPLAASPVFHCVPAAELPRARVEAVFHTDWNLFDYAGQLTAQQTLLDARAVFSISPVVAQSADLTVEIVLLEYSEAPHPGAEQVGYALALKAKAIEVGKPFNIVRHGKAWCYADRKPCPLTDKKQSAFLAALGGSVELLTPVPSVVSAVDGKSSDTVIAVPVPRELANRLGLAAKKLPGAQTKGGGFPVAFVSELRSDQSVLVDVEAGGGKLPRNHLGVLHVVFELDPACRLVAYQLGSDVSTTIAPGTQSQSEFIHSRKYKITFTE